jgi:uncharacterized membrane protein
MGETEVFLMVTVPLHPQIVHLPLALSVLLPLIALVVMVCIRKQKFSSHVWILVAGLQVLTTASGYLAMETGEDEEKLVEKVVGKKNLHEHEERAEMFVASSVAASVLAIATLLIKPALQFYLMITALLLMLGQTGLAWRTGASGGELVYLHQASSAYQVSTPVETNVEDATDDHDYAADEANEDDEEREHDE